MTDRFNNSRSRTHRSQRNSFYTTPMTTPNTPRQLSENDPRPRPENVSVPSTRSNPDYYPNVSNPHQQSYGMFSNVFNPLPQIPFQGYDPKAMFTNHRFINQGNLLHNNLQNILLHEEIREYTVMIDSKDRNYQVYPNPFSYDVIFDPLHKTREIINGKTITYEDPTPVINEKFTNVRYIKLETAILPYYTKIIKHLKNIECEVADIKIEKEVPVYQIDTKDKLTANMYVVLSLGDYSDDNYRSTSDVLADSFAAIYYEDCLNDTHYTGFTNSGIRVFPQDQLAEITKFKIRFRNQYGQLLDVSHLDKSICSDLVCECTQDDETNASTDCFRHNLFHPLNPLFQHHLVFKIGVVEPRIGKVTFD